MKRATIDSSTGSVRRPMRLFRFADVVLCVGVALVIGGFALAGGPALPPPGGECSCNGTGALIKVTCPGCPDVPSKIQNDCTTCCRGTTCTATDWICGSACQAALPGNSKGDKGGAKVIPAS